MSSVCCNLIPSNPFLVSNKKAAIVAVVVTALILAITAVALAAIFSPPVAVALGAGFAAAAKFLGPIGAVCAVAGIAALSALSLKPLYFKTLAVMKAASYAAKTNEEKASLYMANRKTPSHQILGNLYLGNAAAFAQTTTLDWTDTGTPRGLVATMANEERFQAVITVCPLQAINDVANRYTYENSATFEEDLANDFDEQGIAWHQVGKNINDEPEAWNALVKSCSGNADSVDQWFEPTFQVLDAALYKGVKTLIHCQAGQSRSATVLAAYLINRFNISAQQALDFLGEQRPYVASKFTKQLTAYEQALRGQ